MDPTCGLGEKLRDIVLNVIWEHLLYLVCYSQNVEQLNEELGRLTTERRSIQLRIDEASNNVEQIVPNVLRWLGEVDTITEQAEQLHQESHSIRECTITSCPNLWLRYKLSKRAKAMAQEVADIIGRANFPIVAIRVPPPPMLELPTGVSNEGIDSREQIKSQIIEALGDPSVKMVGLCGLGGVGKTTIANDLTKEEEIQKKFDKVIMATVSQEKNIGNIQDQIIDKLGMNLYERTEVGKAPRLHEKLKEEKNMLLILDDLWDKLDLCEVGIPFVDVENYRTKSEGCKILLTSRDEEVLSRDMKCQQIIKVGVLLENEARELFKRIVELPIDSNIESKANAIVQRCGCLPLAIVTAAKALQGKDLYGFNDYLARWKNHLRRNIKGIREVDASLMLSYDNLSPEHKSVFLLAAMMSHNSSIEDLLMYSVGLNILVDVENMEEAHAGISEIVRKLKSLNLFLDSFSSHHFTIHDVFRDAALSIASNESHAFIVRQRTIGEWPDKDRLESYKGICFQQSDISDPPEELYGKTLEFFMLNSTKRDLIIPKMFFKSSEKLKLLVFTNVHFSLLPSLNSLQNLKALCLHSCVLEDITNVRSLRKLKVLSLVHSEIEKLPIELAKLISLQMLNLSHCTKLKVIPQKLLSSFKKLEILYMRNSFDQWKDKQSTEANENTSLEELRDLPISSLDIHIPNVSMLPGDLFLHMNLKRYKILIGKHWEWWQINDKTSKILRLEIERNIHLKGGVRKLMEEVEDLNLCGSNGHKNVLYNHYERGFPCLKHLHIESNDDIKHLVLNSAHQEVAFPVLESLKLKNLKSLENLCEGPHAVEFHELHTLKMENLPALTGDLSIKDIATNNVSNKISRSLFKKVLFPKLEILQLSKLNRLIGLIWDEQFSHNSFSNLKKLIVERYGIVKLVPFHVLKSLNNLDVLEVRDCDMLQTVFDFEDLNDYEEIVSPLVVPLKQLKLQSLPKLKNVWSNHYYQGNVSFPSLRSVDVSFCERLANIFPASIAKEMLHHLEELSIRDCGIDVIVAKDQGSESVAVTFDFPALTSLRLAHLSKLRNFYPHKHTLELSHLHHLSIQCCDELEIFEKEVSSSSRTYEEETTIDSKYPLLSHEKVVRTLEELILMGKQVEMIGSGQFQMFHSLKLKQLCLSVVKSRPFQLIPPDLGWPQLSGDFEETLGGDNVTTLVAPFSKLEVKHVSKFSPSLVSSSNLTHLRVQMCDGLTTLMASSIARSLTHLMHLSVGYSNKMEEIITMEEGEDDENKEIIFKKLKFLELKRLPWLKRFCAQCYTFKFFLLDQLIIQECPKFIIFSPGVIHTPSLKSVQLWQGMEKYHEICDSNLNKIVSQRFFASREVVLDEDDARMIRNDQFLADKCPEVEVLRIERFVDEGVAFPYALLKRFPKLYALHVEKCLFEEIFPSHTDIVDQILAFKELCFANLDRLKNIFPSSTSLDNLTVLKVFECPQLVYLITNFTAKSMVKLDTLELDDCEKMKEIVRRNANEDVEGEIVFHELRILKLTHLPRLKKKTDVKKDLNTEDGAANTGCTNFSTSLFNHNKVLLPKLEIFLLSNLSNNLISVIWDDQILHNSFSNLKTLIMKSCDSMKFIPLRVLKSLNKLEKLEVTLCDKLEKVFGYADSNDYYKEMESSSVDVPLNLTHLEVSGCDGLTTLMTSSATRSLVHLTHLSVRRCNQIKEIITKEEGGDDEDKEIHFTEMEFLEFDHLHRLKRFCGYNYTFKFPLLKQVTITDCPQLTMFCPGDILALCLHSIRVTQYQPHKDIWKTNLNNTIQHLFTFQEVISTTWTMVLNAKNITMVMDVFPKVSKLYVESFKDEGVTFPYRSLEKFPTMEDLYVEHSSFEEIFPSQEEIIAIEGEIRPLRGLHIAYLDKLKSIWKDDFQLPSIHQNLQRLEVKSCCNLAKLAPSSASFKYLHWLSIFGCHQLIHLVTISTAKSLVSLGTLEIHDCKNMEEIVMNETNEDVEGGITFNILLKIKLTDMPSLKMFSSQTQSIEFPILEEIKISGCPKMKMFCPGVLKTPKLSKVKIEKGDIEWKDGGDLNKIMQGLSSTKDSINM